ncbi:MAG: hypothetical protein MI867_09295, partial [Pseudomonadales bacterium]|nr:hypothetical protein [Pseudomonadales bacterium]
MIEDLESRSSQLAGKATSVPIRMDDLLDILPANPGKTGVDQFRRALRGRTVDFLVSTRDPAEQQRAMLDILAIQPGSEKGELFTAYRRRRMEADTTEF